MSFQSPSNSPPYGGPEMGYWWTRVGGKWDIKYLASYMPHNHFSCTVAMWVSLVWCTNVWPCDMVAISEVWRTLQVSSTRHHTASLISFPSSRSVQQRPQRSVCGRWMAEIVMHIWYPMHFCKVFLPPSRTYCLAIHLQRKPCGNRFQKCRCHSRC